MIKILGTLGFLLIAIGDFFPSTGYILILTGLILILILANKISAVYPRYRATLIAFSAIFFQLLSIVLLALSVIHAVKSQHITYISVLIYIFSRISLIISGYFWKKLFTIFFNIFNVNLLLISKKLIFFSLVVITMLDILVVLIIFSIDVNLAPLFYILGAIMIILYGASYILFKIGFFLASISFFIMEEENLILLKTKEMKTDKYSYS